jgi:hypothetical protein
MAFAAAAVVAARRNRSTYDGGADRQAAYEEQEKFWKDMVCVVFFLSLGEILNR